MLLFVLVSYVMCHVLVGHKSSSGAYEPMNVAMASVTWKTNLNENMQWCKHVNSFSGKIDLDQLAK